MHSELKKFLVIKEELVTDLKILIYCHTDELENFDKMLRDADKQLIESMQQIKTMAEARGEGSSGQGT